MAEVVRRRSSAGQRAYNAVEEAPSETQNGGALEMQPLPSQDKESRLEMEAQPGSSHRLVNVIN